MDKIAFRCYHIISQPENKGFGMPFLCHMRSLPFFLRLFLSAVFLLRPSLRRLLCMRCSVAFTEGRGIEIIPRGRIVPVSLLIDVGKDFVRSCACPGRESGHFGHGVERAVKGRLPGFISCRLIIIPDFKCAEKPFPSDGIKTA